MRPWTLRWAALLTVASVPSHAFAATIRGTVTDSSHGVIAGARVTIKDEATGVTRSSATNSAGIFVFTELAVGRYSIDVASPGFKTVVVRKLQLDVADARAVEIELAMGDVLEQVEVDAGALQVKTIGGEVAGLVNGEQVRELPLNGRNFLQLALLMPGVSPADYVNLTDKGLLSGFGVSVSGAAGNANMFTLDGASNIDIGSNGPGPVFPSVEAIEEFKVHRNSYGAEYGQAAGAQVDVVTRAGTNRFQGSAYYFGRNEALDGTNYFLAQAGQPKEKLAYNDFGFTLGGPIVKDKVHFFVSEEWNRSTRGTVRSRFVPTAAERTGDFSGPIIDGCTPPTPVDPLTGEAFPGTGSRPIGRARAGFSSCSSTPCPTRRRPRGPATTGWSRWTPRPTGGRTACGSTGASGRGPACSSATPRTVGRTDHPAMPTGSGEATHSRPWMRAGISRGARSSFSSAATSAPRASTCSSSPGPSTGSTSPPAGRTRISAPS